VSGWSRADMSIAYIVALVVSVLLLGYLVYALLKPEEF
jgi:K+-transporting ATPase KdpF subunit